MSGGPVISTKLSLAKELGTNSKIEKLEHPAELMKSPSMFAKIMISEPLPLLPKTMHVIDEPVKTGGPGAFVQVERFL